MRIVIDAAGWFDGRGHELVLLVEEANAGPTSDMAPRILEEAHCTCRR